jgi:hypothetical protein
MRCERPQHTGKKAPQAQFAILEKKEPDLHQVNHVVWPEKGGGLRGTAWHKMPVIAGFFGSGVLTALSGHEAAFFRYFKKLA